MATQTQTLIDDTRSVERAAASLARAIRLDGDVPTASDRLRARAEVTVEATLPQETPAGPSEDDADELLLAASLSQLHIGTTLLAAESTLEGPTGAGQAGGPAVLQDAVRSLGDTAAALTAEATPPPRPQRFDTRPGGVVLDVAGAATAALDEMSEAAATAATSLLDQAMKPLVDRVPDDWRELADKFLPSGSQLAQWGLRAVRRGIELLTTVVDLDVLDRLRTSIERVLGELGGDKDTTVLLGAAIGADQVRAVVAPGGAASSRDDDLVERLATLSAKYARLCRLLARIAGAIVAAMAVLAGLGVVAPHVAALSGLGLVAVLGAIIVLGRDYTGATDLPGRVRGVRLLVPAVHGADS